MQSYFRSFWGHCWSLSVEEHFYIALPVLLIASIFLVSRARFRWIPFAFPVVVIVCLALRARVAPDADFMKIGSPTHLRFDSLFAGVTLSWLYHFRPEIFRPLRWHWLPLITLLLIGWQFAFTVPAYVTHTIGYTANLIGFSLLMVWAMNTQALERLKPLAAVGKYSYSIYLWHMPLNLLVFRVHGARSAFGFWLYLALAVFLGVAMSVLIEIPALVLRDRYFPSRTLRHKENGQLSIRDQASDLVNA